jgi:hypothetical protein
MEIAGVSGGVKIFAKGVFKLLPAAKETEQMILS